LIDDKIEKIIPIITSNSNISIRIIDWFITNYSKKYNIIYKLNNSDITYFNVYFQYKCMLKAYKKKMFDPFCRKKRIAFYYDGNKCIITTIGQLNFFKWALSYDILYYIEANLKKIIYDMSNINDFDINSTCENIDSTTESEKKNKRHFLSKDANKTINIYNYSVILTFD